MKKKLNYIKNSLGVIAICIVCILNIIMIEGSIRNREKMKNDLAKAKDQYSELYDKYISSEEDNAKLRMEVDTLLIDLENAKKERDTAKSELEDAQQQIAQQSVEIEEPQIELMSYTVKNDCLTPSKGVHYGVSGKETYYNLDMSGVVSIMRGMGNTDEYWVREDGVKMLGNYVMVAANLDLHPRGSLIETSLGTGIVCDTGGFAASDSTQLDIATAW